MSPLCYTLSLDRTPQAPNTNTQRAVNITKGFHLPPSLQKHSYGGVCQQRVFWLITVLGAQTELYVAMTEPRLPIPDMLAYEHIVRVAYADRVSRLGTLEGELAAINHNLLMPRSYVGFICRGPGRVELDVLAECQQAAAWDPGLFDCLFYPTGPLLARLERTLGKNPELRELSSFLSRPRSEDQKPHEDNADAVDGDYLTLFFGVQPRLRSAGGTTFFRNTAALTPVNRSAFCERLKTEPHSADCETIQLDIGQYLTFSLHLVHFGRANIGYEHDRILGSALYARRLAPDLPQNRAHLHPLPERLPRQRPTAEARAARLREVTAS